MKSFKKGNELIFLVSAVIVITGLALFIYQIYHSKLNSRTIPPEHYPIETIPTSMPTSDTITNWNTFKADYFQFKYPNTWTISNDCKTGGTQCVLSENYQPQIIKTTEGGGYFIAKSGGLFSVKQVTSEGTLNLDHFCKPGGPIPISSCDDIEINGYSAKKKSPHNRKV